MIALRLAAACCAPFALASVVSVVESYPEPVIGQALANKFGVRGGFETGNAVKVDGTYHLFVGERAPPTNYAWKMGWTTQIGHWASPDGTTNWVRVETVDSRASLWSMMPVFDEADSTWKLFYVNEESGRGKPGLLVANRTGRDALSQPSGWRDANVSLSDSAFSISNPFKVGDEWRTFIDIGGFRVGLANRSVADGVAGFYTRMFQDDATPLINTSAVVHNETKGAHRWIENPIVAPLAGGGFGALFDWVQGGGMAGGTPLPYFGFSWSPDGTSWPAENGELISVLPASGVVWTDLVRTPTGLIDEGDGTYSFFYAARDTRNATAPYLECAGADDCFWGMGRMRVKISLPSVVV